MRHIIAIALALAAVCPAWCQITRTEYFIDRDPGYARATPVSVTAGNNIAVAFTAPLAAQTSGFHTLGIRARDAQGHWSHTNLKGFYIIAAASATISSTEYFIDTDPGYGKANVASPAATKKDSFAYVLPLSAYPNGFHTLGIRSRDDAGHWSQTHQYVFVISNDSTPATIVKLRYYFTGAGATDSIYNYLVPVPASSVSVDFTANLSGLSANGDYDMHITAISNDGSQSAEFVKHIRVCNGEPAKSSFTYTSVNTQATFINNSTGATSYSWDFGDGISSDSTSPAHPYSNQGNYTVSLIATNTCNSDTAIQSVIISNNSVRLAAKVFLNGPYTTTTGLMTDSLRTKHLIPLNEPYTALGFTPVNNTSGKTVSQEVLNRTGAQAITDWIWVELRSNINSAQIVTSRPALLRRDGNIVDTDGISPVFFIDVTPGSYYVAVRHRNHLGVMSRNAIALNQTAVMVDFTQTSFAAYGNNAQQIIGSIAVMWAGDANGDARVSYNGSLNDKNAVLGITGLGTSNNVVVVYSPEDCNMDGKVSYNGAANDKNKVLASVGLSTPNNIIIEQLPK